MAIRSDALIRRLQRQQRPTWVDVSATNRSGANVWGFFTIDTRRGILYMPFGEPTTATRLLCVDLIATGIIGLKLVGTG